MNNFIPSTKDLLSFVRPQALTAPQQQLVRDKIGFDDALDDWVVTWDSIENGALPIDRLPSVVARRDQANAFSQPLTVNSSNPSVTPVVVNGASGQALNQSWFTNDIRVAYVTGEGEIFSAGGGGVGGTALRVGGPDNTGYLAFHKPNGTRHWYIGFDGSNNANFTNELNGVFAFNKGASFNGTGSFTGDLFAMTGSVWSYVSPSQFMRMHTAGNMFQSTHPINFFNGDTSAYQQIIAGAASFNGNVTIGNGTAFNALIFDTTDGRDLQLGWGPGGFFGLESNSSLGIKSAADMNLQSTDGSVVLRSKFGTFIQNENSGHGPITAGTATFNGITTINPGGITSTTINTSGVQVVNAEAVSSTVRLGAAYGLVGLYGSTLNYISENDTHVFRRGGSGSANAIATFNASGATFNGVVQASEVYGGSSVWSTNPAGWIRIVGANPAIVQSEHPVLFIAENGSHQSITAGAAAFNGDTTVLSDIIARKNIADGLGSQLYLGDSNFVNLYAKASPGIGSVLSPQTVVCGDLAVYVYDGNFARAEAMRFFASRNVAIGYTTDQGVKLAVNGGATFNGTTNFGNGSTIGGSGQDNDLRRTTYLTESSSNPWGRIDKANGVKIGWSGNEGAVAIQPGNADYSGYMAWFKPNGIRLAVMGYDIAAGNDVTLTVEQAGGRFQVNGSSVFNGQTVVNAAYGFGFGTSRFEQPSTASTALKTYETSFATWQEPWRGQASASGATIGFLGATPIVRQTLPAAATDAATTQTLANALRDLAINFGLAN